MTQPPNRCWARALVALSLAGWFAPLAAADDGEEAPLKLKIGAAQKNAVKLVPFAEDAQEQAATQATEHADPGPSGAPAQPAPATDVQRLPAMAQSSESDFQPRFRKPTVRQAQHLEALADEQRAPAQWQPEGTRAERRPASRLRTTRPQTATRNSTAAPTGPTAAGKALIEEAYAKSREASTDTDYSEIISLCGRAHDAGLKTIHKKYARQLTSWAYNRRGEARVAQRRDPEALADFEVSAELNPNSWRAVHNRGVSYAADGRITDAIVDFDRTIELNPRYANAYFNRGELRYAQRKFAEAIRDYQTAIDLGPVDAAMFNSLGHAYFRIENFGEALREFGRAIELDPQYASAFVNRGDAYMDVSRYADAAADYRAAIDADPQMGRAYQAAAWLMATCPDGHYRNEQLALEAAEKAIQLDGENYRNLETLAAAQANAGMFDEAKETQEKAIALVPSERLVAAEKRMALYQRDLAFREVSQQEMVAENQARQEAEAQKMKFPVRRASAEVPQGPRQPASYPAAQPRYRQRPPDSQPNRSFWSKLNPFERSQQPPQRRPRNLPKRPTRAPSQQNVRPW